MTAPHEVVGALTTRLGDRVVGSDSPEWLSRTSPWNVAVPQAPDAVVLARDVDDLRAVLEVADTYGRQVTVQPRGHGATWGLEGTILVRPAGFDAVEVDPVARVARIGAGVTWGRAAGALAGSALLPAYGSNPSTSVVGYLLSGGLPMFGRALGLGVQSLRRVEILTVDGHHRWIDDDSDPELLWALRGAGSALGVVTAVEIDLRPVTALYGGKLLFPVEAAHDVLTAVLTEGEGSDDELSLTATLIAFPPLEELPPFLAGRRVVSVDVLGLDRPDEHSAIATRLAAVATPIVPFALAPLDVDGVHAVLQEPTDPLPARDWSRLSDADTDTVHAIADVFASEAGAALLNVGVRVLGGALAREGDRPAIAGPIRETHVVHGIAIAAPGDERVDLALGELRDALDDGGPVRTVGTFLGHDQYDYSGAYDADSLHRLGLVKAAVDPAHRLVGNRDRG